jgi:putative ABC transport system permease protein
VKVERAIKSAAAKSIAFGFLAVMLATVISSVNHSFNDIFLYDMSRTTEMIRTDDNNAVAFRDLQKLKNEAGVDVISGYGETVTAVLNKFGVSGNSLKIVLIDEDYPSIYKAGLLYGGFPDADMVKKGAAYAVISDQLALKLFMSLNIVGNEIETLGRKYIVSGVYKSRASVLWSLCGDGYDRVFIPYTSVDDYTERPVDIIALLENPDQNPADTEAEIEAVIGNKMTSYRIIRHSASGLVFHQYFDLLIFIIGSLTILFIILHFVRYTINTIKLLKKGADSDYISSLLRAGARRIMSNFLVLLLCCTGTAILIKSIRFKFFIADEFIPDDNIFDIQFYIEAAINNIMLSNSHTNNVYSIFAYCYRNILGAELFCTLLIAVFFIASNMFYNLLFHLDAGLKDLLLVILLIISAGGAAGLLASASLGLGVFFPIKVWTVLSCYLLIILFIRTVDKKRETIKIQLSF